MFTLAQQVEVIQVVWPPHESLFRPVLCPDEWLGFNTIEKRIGGHEIGPWRLKTFSMGHRRSIIVTVTNVYECYLATARTTTKSPLRFKVTKMENELLTSARSFSSGLILFKSVPFFSNGCTYRTLLGRIQRFVETCYFVMCVIINSDRRRDVIKIMDFVCSKHFIQL